MYSNMNQAVVVAHDRWFDLFAQFKDAHFVITGQIKTQGIDDDLANERQLYRQVAGYRGISATGRKLSEDIWWTGATISLCYRPLSHSKRHVDMPK